jgi:stage II sporulation protein AB (anti-sigma F factor)
VQPGKLALYEREYGSRPWNEMRLLKPLFQTRAISMEADASRLQEVRNWAGQAAVDVGLSESECFQVRLAISEAVANAIKHGSSSRGDCIRIEAFEREGALVFEVRDNGTFVAPLARATATEEDESGRGLDVLGVIMDDVEMTSTGGGSVLRFAKRLG